MLNQNQINKKKLLSAICFSILFSFGGTDIEARGHLCMCVCKMTRQIDIITTSRFFISLWDKHSNFWDIFLPSLLFPFSSCVYLCVCAVCVYSVHASGTCMEVRGQPWVAPLISHCGGRSLVRGWHTNFWGLFRLFCNSLNDRITLCTALCRLWRVELRSLPLLSKRFTHWAIPTLSRDNFF